MFYVSMEDICLILPYRTDVFRKFLLVSGGFGVVTKRVPSLRSGRSVIGYPLEETCKFLRQRVPLFDAEAEAGLTRLARGALL